jgi:SET and MYND domain-containing protein
MNRYFVGKNIVLQALRPLETGECVSENYGPTFTKRPLAFRQKTLATRYWFKCSCQACTEDWPTYDSLSSDILRLR